VLKNTVMNCKFGKIFYKLEASLLDFASNFESLRIDFYDYSQFLDIERQDLHLEDGLLMQHSTDNLISSNSIQMLIVP
jgi:hypothetical protein